MSHGKPSYRRRAAVGLFATCAVLGSIAPVLIGAQNAYAASPLPVGTVLAGVGNSTIKTFNPNGTQTGTIATDSTTYNTGMCFDSAGNFYATLFDTGVTKFDNTGTVLVHNFGGSASPAPSPESCVVDKSNNVYFGNADASPQILKFSPTGTLLDSYTVPTESRGGDWIDLASDQKTMYYTSEDGSVLRYDVSTHTNLPRFAANLPGPCYALRIRPNGEVMVACSGEVLRLNSSGGVAQTYALGSGGLFALNLDPDGTTFWTGDIGTGVIYHVNIATGAVIKSFSSNPNTVLGGLAVVGELTVSGNQPTTCVVTAVHYSPPPAQQQVTVHDPDGIHRIYNIHVINGTVSVPSFTDGTKSNVVLTATKADQTKRTFWEFDVQDSAGQVHHCV